MPVNKELWFRGDESGFGSPRRRWYRRSNPRRRSSGSCHRSSATGFLVGLLEWTCIQGVNSHIDWPREQTVGTHVNVSHHTTAPKYCGLRGIHSRRTPSRSEERRVGKECRRG